MGRAANSEAIENMNLVQSETPLRDRSGRETAAFPSLCTYVVANYSYINNKKKVFLVLWCEHMHQKKLDAEIGRASCRERVSPRV